ncbi:MAG: hypothetical protein ACTTNM_01935 [Arsenophonus sp.]
MIVAKERHKGQYQYKRVSCKTISFSNEINRFLANLYAKHIIRSNFKLSFTLHYSIFAK